MQGSKSENTGDEVCSLLSGKPQEVEPSKSEWSEVGAVELDLMGGSQKEGSHEGQAIGVRGLTSKLMSPPDSTCIEMTEYEPKVVVHLDEFPSRSN